jgi:uncharacterized protein (DUF1330 family)
VSVYMIIESKVKDGKPYREYQSRVREIITKFGGRYLSRGNHVLPLSGDWTPERMNLLEFPDEWNIREWLASPEYQRLAPLREAGADSRAIILEGTID